MDVKQSGRSTNIRAEQVNLLPHNRDFTSLVTQAPGRQHGGEVAPRAAGLMIDGAAAAENRYVIDGIETTDIVGGLSGKNLLADFVEEVQVKSTGYPAEYGGSTGGVINVHHQERHATAFTARRRHLPGIEHDRREQPDAARRVRRCRPRPNTTRIPKDDDTRFEPGGSLGGPIFKNRMWFFGAYQPAYTTTKRHVDARRAASRRRTRRTRRRSSKSSTSPANVTNQFGNKLRTRVALQQQLEQDDRAARGA